MKTFFFLMYMYPHWDINTGKQIGLGGVEGWGWGRGAWHFISWCCFIIPSWVSESSTMRTVLSGQALIEIWYICHDFYLNKMMQSFHKDTRCWYIPSDYLWLQKTQPVRRYRNALYKMQASTPTHPPKIVTHSKFPPPPTPFFFFPHGRY